MSDKESRLLLVAVEDLKDVADDPELMRERIDMILGRFKKDPRKLLPQRVYLKRYFINAPEAVTVWKVVLPEGFNPQQLHVEGAGLGTRIISTDVSRGEVEVHVKGKISGLYLQNFLSE